MNRFLCLAILSACSASSAGTKSSTMENDTGSFPSDTTSAGGGESLPGSGSTTDPYTGPLADDYVCTDAPVEVITDLFPSPGWYPEDTMPGTACWCSYTYAGDGTTYRLRSDSLVIYGDNTNGTPGEIASAMSIFGGEDFAQLAVPMDVGSTWVAYPLVDAERQVASTLSGTYEIWMSLLDLASVGTGSPVYHTCADYPGPIWEWSDLVNGETDQASGTRTVTGETANTCSPSTTSTTVFHIADWPRSRSRAPWYQSGNSKFGGTSITSIKVTDWGGATYLQVVGNNDVSTTISDTSSHSLTDSTYWTGSAGWYTDGSPTVSVTTSCPASAGTAETRGQGYTTSLNDVVAAFTGAALTDAKKPDPTKKAPLIARIESEENGSTSLFIDLAGTSREIGIPISKVAGSSTNYTVNFANDSFKVAGSLQTTSTGLKVTLTSASFVGYGGSWNTVTPSKGSSLTLKKYGQ